MQSRLLVIAMSSLGLAAAAQDYPAYFASSAVEGRFGTTQVKMYLGPSPYIAKGVGEFIAAATSTLDVAVYEIDLPMVLGRLLDAHKRGVKVRLAVPPSAKPSQYDKTIHDQFEDLEAAGVLRYTKNKSGLMHNKFMVADGAAIWAGSYNFTKNDTEWNDNNAITLANAQLAENYRAEFEELWAGLHGKSKGTPTPHPVVTIGTTTIKTLFSPEDDVDGAMAAEILKATNSVYLMAFAFTDDVIFNALSNRVAAGVKVYTLFDLTMARQKSSKIDDLKAIKATVNISANNGQMHHKVIVVDEDVVITGSANLSAAAFGVNDENTLIFNSPPLARAMTREFKRCWLARPYIYNKWNQAVGP